MAQVDQFEISIRNFTIEANKPSILNNKLSIHEWDEFTAELNEILAKVTHGHILIIVLGAMLLPLFFIGPVLFGLVGIIIGFGSFFVGGGILAAGIMMAQSRHNKGIREAQSWIRSSINAHVEERGLFFKLEKKSDDLLLLVIQCSATTTVKQPDFLPPQGQQSYQPPPQGQQSYQPTVVVESMYSQSPVVPPAAPYSLHSAHDSSVPEIYMP
ncbi:hypothetical protein GEMRC1_013357 [Eukaryota sp. GEM-RC1]